MADSAQRADLVRGCGAAGEAGYRQMDAYTPFPMEAVFEALGLHRNAMPLLVLCGGILGCVGGLRLCYWGSVVAYPPNVGGRPVFSLPAVIPGTLEGPILAPAPFRLL